VNTVASSCGERACDSSRVLPGAAAVLEAVMTSRPSNKRVVTSPKDTRRLLRREVLLLDEAAAEVDDSTSGSRIARGRSSGGGGNGVIDRGTTGNSDMREAEGDGI
jgi:hypothetical protein